MCYKPTRSCFDCVHAVIDSGDASVGIPVGIDECRSEKVAEPDDLFDGEFDETTLAAKCGDFTPIMVDKPCVVCGTPILAERWQHRWWADSWTSYESPCCSRACVVKAEPLQDE